MSVSSSSSSLVVTLSGTSGDRDVWSGEYGLSFGESTACVGWATTDVSLRHTLQALLAASTLLGTESHSLSASRTHGKGWFEVVLRFDSAAAAGALTITDAGDGGECAPLETIGSWSDPIQWDSGSIPGSGDDVYLSIQNSIVFVDSNVQVRNVFLSDGSILLAETECPDGWTPTASRSTCAKFETSRKSWHDAEAACQAAGDDSSSSPASRAHLALVGSVETNRLSGMLCHTGRANDTDHTSDLCWIGISDSAPTYSLDKAMELPAHELSLLASDALSRNEASFSWVDDGAVDGDARYRQWGRHEPRRDARSATGNCGAMTQNHRWKAIDCNRRLPYLCTRRGTTSSRQLRASRLFWSGGSLRGAGELESQYVDVSSECCIEGAATLVVRSEIHLLSDARLVVNDVGFVTVVATASNGVSIEGDARFARRHNASAGLLTVQSRVRSHTAKGIIEWRLWVEPGAVAEINTDLAVTGGGSMAGAALWLEASAHLILEQQPMELRRPTVDSLVLSANAPIWREDVRYPQREIRFGLFFFGNTPITSSIPYYRLDSAADKGPTVGEAAGVYSLVMSGEQTECLAWHASATAVEEALEALNSIRALGGVDVVRRGDSSRRWHFGFEYEIAYDAAESTTVGTLSIERCAASPLIRRAQSPTGMCHNGEPAVATDEDEPLCIADIDISIDRTDGGETITSTPCSISSTSGRHLHFGGGTCDLTVSSSIVEVASALPKFGATRIARGELQIAGPGLLGDDANRLRDDATRALLSQELPPSLRASFGSLELTRGGILRVSYGLATVEGQWTWTGGAVEGPGELLAVGGLHIAADERVHLSEVRLVVQGTSSSWSNSQLQLKHGASIAIRDAGVDLTDFEIIVQQLGNLGNDIGASGWYRRYIEAETRVVVGEDGALNAVFGTSFVDAPIRNLGDVLIEATLSLGSGGDGYGVWSGDGSIVLLDGNFDLQIASTLAVGKIEVLGGELKLPDIVHPRLSASRGIVLLRGRSLLFTGSVTILADASLAFAANAANVTFEGPLSLAGGRIDFPVYGNAPLVSRFHPHDRARNLDRSNAICLTLFNFSAGKLSGNVDLHLLATSFISGQPSLADAAFIINHVNSKIDLGVLTSYRGAYFENRATLELQHKPSNGIFARQPDPRARWWQSEASNDLVQIEYEENLLRNGRTVTVLGEDSLQTRVLSSQGGSS